MFDRLGIIGLFAGMKQLIKESTEKPVPVEYWNNKALMHEDKMNPDVSPQQFMKNLKDGKYCSSEIIPEQYEMPVKPIVDKEKYEHDIMEYGREIADDNAKQGLYAFVLKEYTDEDLKDIIRDKIRYEKDVLKYGKEKCNTLAKKCEYFDFKIGTEKWKFD